MECGIRSTSAFFPDLAGSFLLIFLQGSLFLGLISHVKMINSFVSCKCIHTIYNCGKWKLAYFLSDQHLHFPRFSTNHKTNTNC